MKKLYQTASGDYCVLLEDHPRNNANYIHVDFVREENGVWKVWQHGSVHRDALTDTGQRI